MATSGGKPDLDPAIRDRVIDDIRIFSDALEAVVNAPSDDTKSDLRRAADRLMRAIARVIIELHEDSHP